MQSQNDITSAQSAVNNKLNSEQNYHSEARHQLLTEFIHSAFPEMQLNVESLPGDASFRRYHRVFLNLDNLNVDKDDSFYLHKFDPSYIVMDAPPELESIETFIKIDELMAPKINVPTLLAKDVKNGFLILQDFGSVEFAHLVNDAKTKQDLGRIDELYRWAIDDLIKLQTIDIDFASESFEVAPYDRTTLKREMDLFIEWFLPYIDFTLNEEGQQIWKDFTSAINTLILKQHRVVVHRDYHSRNLMQDQYHINNLGIIDFQDALIGSYTYDLVSLVRDAYVDWHEEQVNKWIKYYWQNAQKQGFSVPSSLEVFTDEVNLMGVQRHLKVLGIFIRLAVRDGKTRYLADIPKVWRDLNIEINALTETNDNDIKSKIEPFKSWLDDKISIAYHQKFASYCNYNILKIAFKLY